METLRALSKARQEAAPVMDAACLIAERIDASPAAMAWVGVVLLLTACERAGESVTSTLFNLSVELINYEETPNDPD